MRLIHHGFSLVEMLLVISLIAVLMVLAMPALSRLQGSNLAIAGQIVMDEISTARQKSSTIDRTVEVRFISLPNLPSEGFTAIQLWSADTLSEDDAHPLGRLRRLPDGVAVAQSATLSPFIELMQVGTMVVDGRSAAYSAFRISPSGLVEPVPSLVNRSRLYVTVLPTRLASAQEAPPNYFAIQLNPDTSTPLAYRP